MYGYLSLLNLQGFFDTIQINFLIVGHTHGPIDQYFSVLSKKLWGTAFVGSPMALQCLFNECEEPQINRQIWVHRDWKPWLEPVLNKSLKFISIPHVVLFTRELGLSILQHKAFSTKVDFLPLKPQGVNTITTQSALKNLAGSSTLVLEQLDLFGGFDTIFQALVGSDVTRESLVRNASQNQNSTILSTLLPKLVEIDCRAAVESIDQHEYECDVGYLHTTDETQLSQTEQPALVTLVTASNDSLPLVTDETLNVVDDSLVYTFDRFTPTLGNLKLYSECLTKLSTTTAGYCLMLDYNKFTAEWLASTPKVFNYIEEVVSC